MNRSPRPARQEERAARPRSWAGAVLAMMMKAALAAVLSVQIMRGVRTRISPRAVRAGGVALVINTTFGKQEIADSFSIRREALMQGMPYFTTVQAARMAVTALGEIRHRYPATLIGLLLKNDPAPSVRRAAALALGRTGGAAWSVELMEALGDPSDIVRAGAAMVLGRLPDLRVIPALERALLNDPLWTVRLEAARALRNLGPKGESVLKSHLANKEFEMLREQIAVGQWD